MPTSVDNGQCYKQGQPVKIIKGTYKGKKGVYLRSAGKVSAAVSITGDRIQERTLRLSSFAPIESGAEKKERLMAEILDLRRRLKDLEVEVKELK